MFFTRSDATVATLSFANEFKFSLLLYQWCLNKIEIITSVNMITNEIINLNLVYEFVICIL